MPTQSTIFDQEVAEVTPEENQWNGFVLGLSPHQFHWLMKSGLELTYCDAFCGGYMDLELIQSEIDSETAHMEPRIIGGNDQSKKA